MNRKDENYRVGIRGSKAIILKLHSDLLMDNRGNPARSGFSTEDKVGIPGSRENILKLHSDLLMNNRGNPARSGFSTEKKVGIPGSRAII